MTYNELIKNAKSDIKKFIKDNPQLQINQFSDLHNYYDANCYVETLFNDEGVFMISEANQLIYDLDKFIKTIK
jgi:hypothetical protein